MCGIVGAVAKRDVVPLQLECLKRLEYRGYDSAGIAVLHAKNDLRRFRVVGKIDVLIRALEENPLIGNTAIAHTRWATHGSPDEANAHPHFSRDTVGLVHNGIIENYQELRQELIAYGYKFSSETDTEAIAHYIHKYSAEGADVLAAVHKTAQRIKGMFSLAIIHSAEPGRIIAVRNGSPLVIGLGDEEFFLASDRLALTPIVQKFIYLEEGDLADLRLSGAEIYDASLRKVERPVHFFHASFDAADRCGYRHYMQKEIFEQPQAIADTLAGRLEPTQVMDEIFGEEATKIFPGIKRIQIAACGTSYHAGLVARYWLEEFARLPCQVDIASELRYKNPLVEPNTLLVNISQSGETADTLAVARQAKKLDYLASLAICNVQESSLVREASLNFLTHAGVEIGVASTKAFTSQLVSLFLLTLAIAKYRGLESSMVSRLIQFLKHLPNLIENALALNDSIAKLAESFADKQHALYIGRSTCYPIALEGALKMKEISYIHAEAYAAGELKHGPLALVDKNMPVIVTAPYDELFSKLQNNIKEVEARGGELFVFTDSEGNLALDANAKIVKMPTVRCEAVPIVYVIPMQLLAYHVALLKGTDVDQPRNLAKSVTVE